MKKLRIGVADSNHKYLIQLRDMIESEERFSLSFVEEDGKRVIDRIKESVPDIVILDFQLQGGDSSNVIKGINEIEPKFRPYVIVTSTLYNEILIRYIANLGAADFLSKPYNIKDMMDRMRYLYSYINNSFSVSEDRNLLGFNLKQSFIREKCRLDDNREEMYMVTGVAFELLLDAGIPVNSNGFVYIMDAVKLIYGTDIDVKEISVINRIYPRIAAMHDVNPRSVERCIRTAISSAWDSYINSGDDSCNTYNILRKYKSKPTNKDLIIYTGYCIRRVLENGFFVS